MARYIEEWKKNRPQGGSSRRIPLEDVLDALGLATYRERVETDIHEERELDQLFGTPQ